jgi:uncharacterized protein (TIGR02453 family)
MKIISNKIFLFLESLKKNNNREWFELKKIYFKSLESEIKEFSESLKIDLNKIDSIDYYKVFRIYRDVRFSNNKTPYKTNFGISFHRTKPNLRGGYYLHIESNNTFIAVGFWNPNKEDLYRIRKELDNEGTEFKKIINRKKLKLNWGSLQGSELKTSPRRFTIDNKNIDLIKKKQFLFVKRYSNSDILSSNFHNYIIDDFKSIRPFLDFMTLALTTDCNGVSSLN